MFPSKVSMWHRGLIVVGLLLSGTLSLGINLSSSQVSWLTSGLVPQLTLDNHWALHWRRGELTKHDKSTVLLYVYSINDSKMTSVHWYLGRLFLHCTQRPVGSKACQLQTPMFTHPVVWNIVQRGRLLAVWSLPALCTSWTCTSIC